MSSMEEKINLYKSIWANTNNTNYSMITPSINVWEASSGIIDIDIITKSVFIINEDPIKIAQISYSEKLRSLVVVENDGINPVPALTSGIVNDSIYLRSNICNCFNNSDILSNLKTGDLLITKDVVVYKDEKYDSIKLYKTDVVLVAPKKNPSLIGINGVTTYKNDFDLQYTIDVIDKIFQAGQEYPCLILNDFGCSYLNNNPISDIVNILNEMIKKYTIPIIVFCVGKNSNILNDAESDERFQYFNDFINH